MFSLVTTVNNSYYTRFNVYLSTYTKVLFLQEILLYLLLHGITVFEIFDGIRNQYCSITT